MIDPALGTIAGGVANLVGGIFQGSQSVKAQKLANQSNEKIARENNAWQRENMRMQNDWNIEQWNRENEYNSASAQAQRFREAGLNPYLAMTGGADAGTASSVTSADAGQASEVGRQMPIDYSAYNGVMNTLSQLPLQVAQAKNLGSSTDKNAADAAVSKATAEGLGIENWYKGSKYQIEIQKMLSDLDVSRETKKYISSQIERQNIDNDFFKDYEVNNARKQEVIQHAYALSEQAANLNVQTKTAKILQKYVPLDKAYSYSQSAAMTANLYAQAGLAKEQARKTIADTFVQNLNGREKKALLENPQFNNYIDGIIKSAYYGGEQGAMDYYLSPFKFALGGIGSFR